ncbi:DUF2177 family protein [Roseovarius sp. 2305UL8-3]|uniref:DUF2177 family protein n=1 Tax=Roseovarius conchicola TaxID=3121636 RepID=UPI003529AB78
MQIIWLYLATAFVFFGLDFFGLRYLIKPVFDRYVGELLAESVRIGPAFAFYSAYIAGVLYFASLPALKAGNPTMALVNGAILGALAYGTYEFTNLATLKHWNWHMVAVDLTWGTLLTGVSAWAGVMIVRALS